MTNLELKKLLKEIGIKGNYVHKYNLETVLKKVLITAKKASVKVDTKNPEKYNDTCKLEIHRVVTKSVPEKAIVTIKFNIDKTAFDKYASRVVEDMLKDLEKYYHGRVKDESYTKEKQNIINYPEVMFKEEVTDVIEKARRRHNFSYDFENHTVKLDSEIRFVSIDVDISEFEYSGGETHIVDDSKSGYKLIY